MDLAAAAERLGHIDAVCTDDGADAAGVESALVAVRELSGWLEAHRSVLVGKLTEQVACPEMTIAAVERSSLGSASRTRQRCETLASTPALAATLGDGATTAAHVDVVTRAAAQLPIGQRRELFDRVDALAAVAASATVAEFGRRVAVEARRIQSDDGLDRLARQRAAVRVSTWVDGEGMWNLRGRFDPVTGVRLDATLRTTLEAVFATAVPQGCPDDPVDKQRFLAAHALTALIDASTGVGSSGRGTEVVVVIDADTAGQSGPVVEWSIPVEIPTRVLAELAGDGDVHAVVVRNGIVIHAPGALDLGRTTRLANRAQRRALRGLYATCAIPGCQVHYDRCKLHHIIWWRHGGRTDLNNLIPLCSRHHHDIHDHGWTIHLGPHRQLTLTLPDGTTHTTAPPRRTTAA